MSYWVRYTVYQKTVTDNLTEYEYVCSTAAQAHHLAKVLNSHPTEGRKRP